MFISLYLSFYNNYNNDVYSYHVRCSNTLLAQGQGQRIGC